MSDRSRRLIGPRAYTLLWDGHSIVGVVTGLALFVMFLCGALALYRGELHQWADPALRTTSTQVASIDSMLAPLLERAPIKPGGNLVLTWPFGDRPYFYVQYQSATGRIARWVVPQSRETLPDIGRSRLPDVLNDLHFFDQLGTSGRLLAGVLGLVFLFLLVTGLAVHLHKLPQDLHTFRPRDRLRVSLADAHAVLGTIGIPFTAMYALTGAYFSLLIVVYGGLAFGALDGDRQRLGELIGGFNRPAYQSSNHAASSLSFNELLARFHDAYPDAPPFIMEVEGWGDASSLVTFEANAVRSLGSTAVATLSASTGDVVAGRGPTHTPPMTLTAAAFGVLHFARFGGGLLKALFFVLALAASAVILTGNVLWLEVRRSQNAGATPWIHRLLARLTSGVGVGLVAAVPVLFLTTRAVPIEQVGRMTIEEGAFFAAWALFVVAALAWPSAAASARVLTSVGGLLAIVVPFADGFSTGAWPWVSAGLGYWTVFSVDVCASWCRAFSCAGSPIEASPGLLRAEFAARIGRRRCGGPTRPDSLGAVNKGAPQRFEEPVHMQSGLEDGSLSQRLDRVIDPSRTWTLAHPCNSRTLRQFPRSLAHERTAAFPRLSRGRWMRPATPAIVALVGTISGTIRTESGFP